MIYGTYKFKQMKMVAFIKQKLAGSKDILQNLKKKYLQIILNWVRWQGC